MKDLNLRQGMTLIELILAIAILAILVVGFLSMFTFAYTNILSAGARSEEILEVQSIIDDMNSRVFNNPGEIEAYLISKGYNNSGSMTSIETMNGSNSVNFYVNNTLQTKADTDGYEVTILGFFRQGKNFVKITNFFIEGGA